MPFLCKLIVDEYIFRDGEVWTQMQRGERPYDLYNLFDAIQLAKDGTMSYYNIEAQPFIKWCAGEIKKQIQAGYKPPQRR